MVLKKVKNGLTSGRKKRKLHSKILGKGKKTVFTGIFEFRRYKKNSFWANSWALLITRLLKLLPKRIFTSAHETSFLGLLTKRVLPIFFSPYECLRNEFSQTSFLRLLTKRVLMTWFSTRALRTLISIGFKNQHLWPHISKKSVWRGAVLNK